MITIDVPRHGRAAIDLDEPGAKYEVSEWLSVTTTTAARCAEPASVRVLVEVQQYCGGMSPRAVLGGAFVADGSQETQYRVGAGEPMSLDHEAVGTCPGRLWTKTFLPGLPSDFATAVLAEIAEHTGPKLPGGVLTVDRAGYDVVNSSESTFRRAACLLRQMVVAALRHSDREADARLLMARW